MITILNGIIAYILLVVLGYQAKEEIRYVIQNPSGWTNISLSFSIIACDMILPLILAVLNDKHSINDIFKYILPILFLLPTFTAYFATYSYSRLSELTWGNRPSNSLITVKKKKTPKEIEDIKQTLFSNAKLISYGLMILNCLLTFIITYFRSVAYFLTIFCVVVFGCALIMMIISLIYFSRGNSDTC